MTESLINICNNFVAEKILENTDMVCNVRSKNPTKCKQNMLSGMKDCINNYCTKLINLNESKKENMANMNDPCNCNRYNTSYGSSLVASIMSLVSLVIIIVIIIITMHYY